jgi:hypothetical protein
MNGPIVSLEVLVSEYAVKGWTWVVFAVGPINVALQSNDGHVQWFVEEDGTLGHSIGFDSDLQRIVCPARVAITICCAHLGLPTPWRAAEWLVEQAKLPHHGPAISCHAAARRLRGEHS